MPKPRMIRCRGEGVTIQAADWPGSGLPILAVHGLTANCRAYDLIAQALCPAHRLIAVDLRGRGLSDKPETGYSLAHHVADLVSVLAQLDLKRVAYMGHSLGAYIGLALVHARPELVDRLILLDGGGQLTPEQWAKVGAAIQPSLDRLGQTSPSFPAYLEMIKKAPYLQPFNNATEDYFRYDVEELDGGEVRSRIRPEHIAEERANLARVDTSSFYQAVKCPVLVLKATQGMLSDDDFVLPEDALKRLQQDLPQVRLATLPGLNHINMLFQPSRIRDQALLDFLSPDSI